MNKKLIYPALLVIACFVVGFVILKDKNKEDKIPPIKERSARLASLPDWAETKTKATDLYTRIQQQPTDEKLKLQLAALYIQEARVTGDHLYYDRAAMQLVDKTLKADSANFEALCFKSMIYLSEHHFADGLTYAQKAQSINPYNSFVYGLMTDAYVELGDYPAAVSTTDKMVSIRPDLRSYSRVSYLREIHGDYPGAIEAMKMAVSAGYPGAEETEWARIQLGHLYENTGMRKEAQREYELALYERPDYAYAYAGLGRIAESNKYYKGAIANFEKADGLVEDYSFKDELIDLYLLNGEKEKSEQAAKKVLDKLNSDAQAGTNDAAIGHYSDRELAYVYVKTGDYAKALEHAEMEYNRRPDNIDANETLAWVHYKKGDYKEAAKYIAVALKTNSQNPTLLTHAALIYQKAGDTAKAAELSEKASKDNAYISPVLAVEASKELPRKGA
ncbi:MAG: tetratricopeptide repeat protein [Bacteroidetes bacterium]|nr:tetratricopeptide repeat protein [Bacteroidota bacterium]